MLSQFDVIIITGPTASGKTDLSYELAENIGGEIINADMGQFYTPLSVGTAKPSWEKHKIKSHLFDIVNEPKNFSVSDYRKQVFTKIKEIKRKGKIPIIVGGSVFYIKSIFFPPICFEKCLNTMQKNILEKDNYSWNSLNSIDPERARQIHPNDSYRINRAIDLWKSTGQKPSELIPQFENPFNLLVICIFTDKKILRQRIFKRTEQMIMKDDWIEETKRLIDTCWELFVSQKNLIGYKQIINWIKNGQKQEDLNSVILEIQQKTWQYAKRQITFLKKFLENIEKMNTDKKLKIVFKQ